MICRCFDQPLPSRQEECIDECVSEFQFVSEACEQCITRNANRCGSLEVECAPLCQTDQPPQPGDPGPADAGGI
ncbi:MAG TPA: hypothetical protein VFQ53_15875 [Kofleriaceae bacterium]|nr:hypothetical protein [Kofleriaceae bacterium]